MDIKQIRKDFPILKINTGGRNLIYFDNAATSQKPRQVIDIEKNYYENTNANVHRGIYNLSEESSGLYEKVREKTALFIGAKKQREIVFVRNSTEAINLVAYAWGRINISRDDEILTSITEHHSNFVPWQQLAIENGSDFKILDIQENYCLQDIQPALSTKTKIVALTHVSNVLGTINPIKQIIKEIRARAPRAIVVVDGSQAASHFKVDVADLDCDFYVLTAHKMFGPTGVGVLWGREKLLKSMPPFLFGGGMVSEVYLDHTDFTEIPGKFEAGTPNIAGVIGLGAAIDYLNNVGFGEIEKREKELTIKLLKELRLFKELTIYGPKERVPVVSFTVDGIHPHDIAQFLNDEYNIAVRAGHHCCMPLHNRLGVAATVRASLSFYNTKEEIEIFAQAIKELIWTFTRK